MSPAARKTIRVGSGGIMLPNHAPLVIAEQFGTLESLYPGRIDLGLGRRPAATRDRPRARAATGMHAGDTFPARRARAAGRTSGRHVTDSAVRAIPGEGLNVPIYILGSSDFGARLAAELGFAVRVRVALRAGLPACSRSTCIARTSSRPSNSTART